MSKQGKKPKTGRPALPADQRKGLSFAFRMRPKMRATLEKAAKGSDRSLSQEIEFRLEQSFERDSAAGGKELRGLFRLMAGAAEIIEARTGKALSEDPETFTAVRNAWDRLIAAFVPKLTAEFLASISVQGPLAELPPEPVPPKLPEGEEMGLLGPRLSPKQEAASAEKQKKYYQECRVYDAALAERRRQTQEVVDRINVFVKMGRDVALSLLPPKPKT